MSWLEFLKNQQFAYYKTIFTIFLVLAIIFATSLLYFLKDNFSKSIKIATVISIVLIVIIINVSKDTYNSYVKEYSSKKKIGSELGLDFSFLDPNRALHEGVMNFLNVTYNEAK
ncbi:hypothetical protein [Clostridium sp.]|uniref:hypothetical protein n=1 Tax=Clostridium sp. TaxID=1506 RepID=UPI0026222E13|nr:hypothetical protein [Clostridium sp.]